MLAYAEEEVHDRPLRPGEREAATTLRLVAGLETDWVDEWTGSKG